MNTERAAKWGNILGRDMAQRQANRMHNTFGVTAFFSGKELEMNATNSARSEALDQRVSDDDWQVWRNVFVAAYTEAYQSYVAEWNEKHQQAA